MLGIVQTEFRYRGRIISGTEIESVRQLIADHPGLSRRRLSAKLCQSWSWVQDNAWTVCACCDMTANMGAQSPRARSRTTSDSSR